MTTEQLLDPALPRIQHVLTAKEAIAYVLDHLKHHLRHPHPLNTADTESAFEKAFSGVLGLVTYAENVVHLKTVDDTDTHSWMVVVAYKSAYYEADGRRLGIDGSFDCKNPARWWSRLHRLLWSCMITARDPQPELTNDQLVEMFNLIRIAAGKHVVIKYPRLDHNHQLRERIHWLNCQLTIPTISIDMNAHTNT